MSRCWASEHSHSLWTSVPQLLPGGPLLCGFCAGCVGSVAGEAAVTQVAPVICLCILFPISAVRQLKNCAQASVRISR